MYSVYVQILCILYYRVFGNSCPSTQSLKSPSSAGESRDSEQDTYSFLFGRILCSRIILDIMVCSVQEVRTGKFRDAMLGGGVGPVLKPIFLGMFLARNPFNNVRSYLFPISDDSLSTCWQGFCYI
jgi:hypothetical protein